MSEKPKPADEFECPLHGRVIRCPIYGAVASCGKCTLCMNDDSEL